jgi:hypothetical protein
MREAYNGKEAVDLSRRKHINIEIIDGGSSNHCFNRFASFVKTDETYLCRCWWGSTEFTFFQIAK